MHNFFGRKCAVFIMLCASSVSAACAVGEGEVGRVQLAVTQAPPDVQCLRITVAGSRTVVRLLPLSAGQNTVYSLNGLPLGRASFSAEAFVIACASVGVSTVPDWVSDAVEATIESATVAQVVLRMRRNGRASVGVDFVDDPDAGAPPEPPDAASPDSASDGPSPSDSASGDLPGQEVNPCEATEDTTYVDPLGGSDEGIRGAASCPFRTLTRAFATVGAPSRPTRVLVKAAPGARVRLSASTGEQFPLRLPRATLLAPASGDANQVRILPTATGGGLPVVGFRVEQPGAAIVAIAISGEEFDTIAPYDHGIVVAAGGELLLRRVAVLDARQDAVRVEGNGALRIETEFPASSTIERNRRALLATDDARVVLFDRGEGPPTPIMLWRSREEGIRIEGRASLVVQAHAGRLGFSTVFVAENGTAGATGDGAAGVVIAQDAANPPLVDLEGLSSTRNPGAGIVVHAGSRVRMRGVSTFANDIGVHIRAAGVADALGRIDLGADATTDPGRNRFQEPDEAALAQGLPNDGRNRTAGLCLDSPTNAGEVLLAAGNKWIAVGNTIVDCASAAAVITAATSCLPGAGVSVAGPGLSGNSVILNRCTRASQ